MRTRSNIIRTIAIIIVFLTNVTSISAQDLLQDSKKMGLVSYLTAVKSISEYKLISLADNEQYKIQTEKASDFRANYNCIKLYVDMLVSQLSADMTLKNKLRLYKLLDKYVKGEVKEMPEKYSAYEDLLIGLDGLVETFLMKTYSSMQGASIDEFIGALELVHTIVTDVRDFREKKIQCLIKITETTRLNSVKDLTETKSKDQ